MDIKCMLAYSFMSMEPKKHEKVVRQDGFRMFSGLRSMKCGAIRGIIIMQGGQSMTLEPVKT